MAASTNRRIVGIILLLLLGAGTYELWLLTALRDRPRQLESYVDILTADCRTRAGAYAFPEELRALTARIDQARLCLVYANEDWVFSRDYSSCVSELLTVSLDALRLRTCEEVRLREEKTRLAIILGALRYELGMDPTVRKAGVKFQIRTYSQSRAKMLVEAACNLAALGQTESAVIAALRAQASWSQNEDFVASELARFYDPQRREQWEKEAQDLLRWTKQTGRSAILVDKLEHRCLLLTGGRIEKTYTANLGRNWYRIKVQEHDASTPEGEYTIKRKFHSGSFGWALLLDYPNAADRQRFESMKKSGALVARARIGGLIEIHGGGRLSSDWTDGCVSLENSDMVELYKQAYVGMPVTIVGASRLGAAVRE